MYKLVMKPILFLMNVERARLLVVWMLKILGRLPFGCSLLKSLYRVDHPSLERTVLGIHFSNPIGVAAGFDTNGEIVNELGAMGFGFVEVGSITPEPQSGNPKPRLFRLDKDMALVNRMGHPNKGWASAIKSLRNRRSGVVVGCNIARNNNTPHSGASKEYLKSFRNLYQYVDYFTVNINYSHLEYDGSDVTAEDAITELLTPLFEFRRGQSDYRPILIKVSPDLDTMLLDAVSDVLIETPLDGVVAVDGTLDRMPLKESISRLSQMTSGRLSGAPLLERSLEVIRHIAKRTEGAYPIIGVGGVLSAADVNAMLEAGASLVQVYSGLVYGGPSLVGDMCREMIVEDKV